MPSKTEFDAEIEGERFIELNLEVHALILSVFGCPENYPTQTHLQYLDTLEEVRRKGIDRIFVEINAEIDIIMMDLSKVYTVTLLPRADKAMKNPMFTVASAKIIRNPFAADPVTDRDVIKTTKGETVQGTWDWVLQTPEFIKWRTSNDNFIWISRGLVKDLLQGRSGASYLWTHLALQSLQQVKASDMVDDLENLPQELEDLYEWQLSQIETDQREFALEALKWCALSERPRELSQLVEVLPNLADGSLTPEDALRSRLKHCGIMIKVSKRPRRFTFLDWFSKARTIMHGEYETVTIVHRSVCDFLTRVSSPSRWYSLQKTTASHLDIAIKCLSSMNAGDVRDVIPETSNGSSSFLHYASECWSYHFRRTGKHAIDLVNNHPEYFNESPWFSAWLFSLGITKGSIHWRLSLAAVALGLDDLVEYILEHERSKLRILKIPMLRPVTVKMLGTTPLHLAAQNGHLSTVKMLLEGIPINTMDSKNYTPMFLEGRADITPQHPLLRAIWAHDEAMVKFLLGWSPSIGIGNLQSATRVPIWVDGERDSMVALLLPVYARQEAK
ncbi:NACHT and Ankyrin domain-containing protein [Fusarium proliferatum]|nr:NACHT and Ankyrin domain-containing protein [Fusarium proliferatum]KAG4268770.1 NACHT and Ankyrin domain-containing protein [Fusarium proliferatum]